ncbi:nitroreductase family protein [Marivirga salinae]|uniref:Nitroreductase family protein n=1 Tax=Marivirga salinarum TaxID=3059078 RepID=A0AA49J8W5_9BACT|nr:nitroreductase family protein [Marivirga sp. BDSF4-3]WKK77426.2 nitroreductase family protein [Marivirga sp. BDSF4-3]
MENQNIDTSQDLAQVQLDLIKKRKSPVAFSEKEVAKDQLEQLFEAVRWAASCFNEQPWRFVVATKDQGDHYQKVLNGLNPHNQTWAQNAPVLMLTFAKKTFDKNGRPNMHSWHDLGLAMGNMSAQSTAMGLYLHQMAGIVRDNIQKDFDIPEDYEIVSGIALGYKLDIEDVPEDLKDRETKERTRKSLNEFVFNEAWGESSF